MRIQDSSRVDGSSQASALMGRDRLTVTNHVVAQGEWAHVNRIALGLDC
jgi:hypothetical protein